MAVVAEPFRAVGTGWAEEARAPLIFLQISYPYLNQEGKLCTQHITTYPPDFQTFWQPCI